MRKYITLTLILITSLFSYGQENSEFIDSIKRLVIQESIPVFDAEYHPISHKALVRQFVWIDTFINDVWTRPRFVDNIYREELDGMLIKSLIILDTITDPSNPNYLSFFTEDHDDSGNFIRERVVFKLDKRINPKKENKNTSNKLKGTSKKIIKTWKTVRIKKSGKVIQLDSCNLLHRIAFNPNAFHQYFIPNNNECFTEAMKNHLVIGIEGNPQEFDHYYNKVEGHYIENKTGYWSISGNRLLLQSEDGLIIIQFIIKKISHRKLLLVNKEMEYEVYLKRASH